MIIGIPKESWGDERRVALIPAGVYSLAKSGHTIIVQADAGTGSGFSSDAFRQAGATLAFSAEEVFTRSDLLVKVLPATVEECGWIPEHTFLLSMVQLGAAKPAVFELLRQRRVIAVGFEFIEESDHNLPVLTAMSEIAGMLLPQIAGRFLETPQGGRGILLGGIAGIPASNVVIIGAGTVGATSARGFLGSGANITILDEDLKRLHHLEMLFSKMVNTALATPYNIERHVSESDVVVGALIHGRKAPHVVSEAIVMEMKAASVILDVSIDQGGCVQTSRPTTLSDPVFMKHGVTHYCVPNIPSSVARTASQALNNVILPFVEQLGEKGVKAFGESPALRRGVYLYDGQCVHEGLAGLVGYEYSNIDQLLG